MTMQSPIDIGSDVQYEPLFKIQINWKPKQEIRVEGVKYSLKIPTEDMGGLVLYDLYGVGPLHYKLDNGHFHVHSEHTLNG